MKSVLEGLDSLLSYVTEEGSQETRKLIPDELFNQLLKSSVMLEAFLGNREDGKSDIYNRVAMMRMAGKSRVEIVKALRDWYNDASEDERTRAFGRNVDDKLSVFVDFVKRIEELYSVQ